MWKICVSGNGRWIETEDGQFVCGAVHPDCADLLAHAPDLLSACRRVLEALNDWSKETGSILWINHPAAVHESANELLAGVIELAEGR
jgi:hypothetical protein